MDDAPQTSSGPTIEALREAYALGQQYWGHPAGPDQRPLSSDEVESRLRELAQQSASDGGFTAADMMDARQEGRREALVGLKDLMLRQVKWEPCDCGCPQQRTPDGPHSVTWLRAAQQVEIAIAAQPGGDS